MLNVNFLASYINFYEKNLGDVDSEKTFNDELKKVISCLEENNLVVTFSQDTIRSLPATDFWLVTTCNILVLNDGKIYSSTTHGYAPQNKFQALLYAIDKYLYNSKQLSQK